jgi:hypothetical protein
MLNHMGSLATWGNMKVVELDLRYVDEDHNDMKVESLKESLAIRTIGSRRIDGNLNGWYFKNIFACSAKRV